MIKIQDVISKLTTSGWKNLWHSLRSPGAERSVMQAAERELSVMGKVGLGLAAPILIIPNALAHGAALTVKGYRGAFGRAPIVTSAVTAAVAVPAALSMLAASKKHNNPAPEQMAEVDQAQGATQQVQDVLMATEQQRAMQSPQMAASDMAAPQSSLQEADTRIAAANSVQEQGRVNDTAQQAQL